MGWGTRTVVGLRVGFEERPEFLKDLIKSTDPYIKESRKRNKLIIKQTKDFGYSHSSTSSSVVSLCAPLSLSLALSLPLFLFVYLSLSLATTAASPHRRSLIPCHRCCCSLPSLRFCCCCRRPSIRPTIRPFVVSLCASLSVSLFLSLSLTISISISRLDI